MFPGGLYNVSFAMIMNPAKWSQISEADRAAINKLSGEALARRAGKAWDATDAKGEKAVRDANIPVVIAGRGSSSPRSRTRPPDSSRPGSTRSRPRASTAAAALAALRGDIAAATKK